MNQKTNVIVSTFVDNLIKESQPDMEFFVFSTIQELSVFIETHPIRAQRLYFTRETIMPATTSALSFLVDMLKNPFLVIDEVVYLSEEGSSELSTVSYITEQLKLDNWKVVLGSLTREYITSYISGFVKTEELSERHKVIYRIPKAQYVRRQLNDDSVMDEPYDVEEKTLSDIPEEVNIDPLVVEVQSVCKIVTVTGLPEIERTMFAFMCAQYLALRGKTLIIEHDFEFLSLTDLVSRTTIKRLSIDIGEFYRDPDDALNKIRNYHGNLVVITCDRPSVYSYSFICNVIYNSLIDCVDYLVAENDFTEVGASDYIVAIPNDIVSVLKTVQLLPDGFEGRCSFVGINSKTVNEISIKNVDALHALISELTGMRYPFDVDILNFTSLTIGGSVHDLRMFIGR